MNAIGYDLVSLEQSATGMGDASLVMSFGLKFQWMQSDVGLAKRKGSDIFN